MGIWGNKGRDSAKQVIKDAEKLQKASKDRKAQERRQAAINRKKGNK